VFSDLMAALREHGFADTGTLPYPGGPSSAFFDPGNVRRYLRGERNSHEYSSVAPLFYQAFARKNARAIDLFALFTINHPVKRSAVEQCLPPELVQRLLDLRMLVDTADGLVSRLTVTPCGELLFGHDHFAIQHEEKAEHVFLGRCSMRLADRVSAHLATRRLPRGLDLCTGSGVQASNMARRCDEVIGGDVNRRALAFARANARANGLNNVTFIESDLFTNIPGRFDIVTANTPFLLLPEGSKALSGNGGHLGMEVELRLFEQLDKRLNPGGVSFIVASSVMIRGENVLETKLAEIFHGTDYEIELNPINTYYQRGMYETYTKHGVDSCILYVVDLAKGGSGLRLKVNGWPTMVDVAYRLQVARNKLEGWVSQRRRSDARS